MVYTGRTRNCMTISRIKVDVSSWGTSYETLAKNFINWVVPFKKNHSLLSLHKKVKTDIFEKLLPPINIDDFSGVEKDLYYESTIHLADNWNDKQLSFLMDFLDERTDSIAKHIWQKTFYYQYLTSFGSLQKILNKAYSTKKHNHYLYWSIEAISELDNTHKITQLEQFITQRKGKSFYLYLDSIDASDSDKITCLLSAHLEVNSIEIPSLDSF